MQQKNRQQTTYKERITTSVEHKEKIMIEREVVPGYRDVKLRVVEKFDNGPFISVFQEILYEITTKGRLNRTEYALFNYFMAVAKTDGSVILDLPFLCLELDLLKSNCCTALNSLVKRNIILKKCLSRGDRRSKKPDFYELSLSLDRLNYNLVWKDKVKKYKEVKHLDPIINHEPKLLEPPQNRTLFDAD